MDNNRNPVIGIMGGGSASSHYLNSAEKLGSLIAENNYILLNGGRNKGIMEASSKGAFEKKGIVIGILPGEDLSQASKFLTIPIRTGIGNARNQINILSSDIVVAFPGGPGTVSEIAFALKMKKHLILFDFYPGNFIDEFLDKTAFRIDTPEQAIIKIKELIKFSDF